MWSWFEFNLEREEMFENSLFIPISLTTLVIIVVVVCLIAVYGTYKVSKWPIFFMVSTLLMLEFGCYLILRYLVTTFEFLFVRSSAFLSSTFSVVFAPNSLTARYHALSRLERNATTFEQWKQAAIGMDVLEGREGWKESAESHFYDCAFIEF